jgi:hypothetical protein
MPWCTASANALLQLLLWNVNFANIGDATGLRGSTTVGNLWAFLATADPGASGSSVTNEAAYPAYARVQLARTNGVWNISGNVANPIANIQFPMATGGSEIESFWGLTPAASGASIILLRGALSPTISVSNLKTPIITPASTLTLPTA